MAAKLPDSKVKDNNLRPVAGAYKDGVSGGSKSANEPSPHTRINEPVEFETYHIKIDRYNSKAVEMLEIKFTYWEDG